VQPAPLGAPAVLGEGRSVGRRLGRVAFFAAFLAIASPSFGLASQRTERCKGTVRAHHKAACTIRFSIPHFNASDSIDDSALVARVISPEAGAWRVSGTIYDARGIAYFAWYCSADTSSTTAAAGTYAGHSCGSTRRTVRVRRGGHYVNEYYVANTNGAQRMVIVATVSQCVPTALRGCRYEGKATYQFAR